MNIQLCILNAQGILLDSNKSLIRLYQESASRDNLSIPEGFFENILSAGFDHRQKVFYQYPRLAQLENEVMQHLRHCPVSFQPQIVELLDFLKSHQIKIAIVSDQRREDILPQIQSLIEKYEIDVLVCSNEVLTGKPDPNVYLKAAKLSNVKPANTLVIDDSRNGCYAAHLAYMRCVFYKSSLPISERLFKYSYRQITQLNEVIEIIRQENDPKVIFLFFQIQSHHFHVRIFRFDRNIDDRCFFNAFDQ
jgi:HAD superfamily hydrolase (TIGR01509 family)